MIRLSQLTLIRGVKPLIEAADLTLNPGEKVGLIGANGSGKSSLFALLRNELHADAGDVDFPAAWRIAHVAQETPALDRSALDYAIDGDTTLRRLEAELAVAEAAHDGLRIGELHGALQDADAYTVRARAEQLLTGLGFTNNQMRQPLASFSGGWRMRLNLAQALMCPSDLLLLDEPTNHLDLDAIIWLEDWLKRYPGTLIVISHDRDFLDGVVNVIVHIDGKKLKRYGGNYSSFEKQRAIYLALGQSAFEKQSRERAHLQSFIDRFKSKASKAKQAQSRMKMLAKMEDLAPIHAAAAFSFEFGEPDRAPNPLLVLEGVAAGYGDKVILSGIDLNLQAGQRIGLLGVNGAGKSTLIKTLVGDIPPLSGKLVAGKGLVIGYFAQQQLEMLRHDQSPLWHLAKLSPRTREQELRNFLGGFNFNGEMATAAIAPLSGGEKARLALALIVWQRPNLLLLDEPTNHLDLETREALTVALAQFEGTLILVSHDRHLLRATSDEFMIVADGGLRPFDGDLDDYRDWLFKRIGNKVTSDKVTEKPDSSPCPSVTRRPSKEQKRLEAEARQRLAAQKKPVETRIQRLEEQMARHNARQAMIDAHLADPEIYADTRKDELKQLTFEQASLAKNLEQLESEWMEQHAALEALSV
ncbi:MAG: ABC transporter [Hydrogenophilales bacterium CG03_land_8_20_14_0_80_62_28]|nr:ATP-binding cassette domain-containing protein [Betaproteobacteria bacterium]PIV24173.1 MAG: ABC transporter [Hydrogenophilales bacterium CG03_land_8_20_14_0_80_62_28]PIX01594.1 MAG: ABC transporter [Hydrogenophilales bacterium CG_4_8_14_3_um_filter_62_83]PIY99035.1 MAG: ABC transporter [Hydrogenophilales bacterium CG_4_10_14_0_8_um_filter_62_70]